MTLKEYRQRYADLYNKIQTAEQELNRELAATQTAFDKRFQWQKEIDKRWFVANLDFFLKYKKHFTSHFGLDEIIIDFLTLFHLAGMVGGAGFGTSLDYKISIKDLLTLWDEGFTYQGYPIIAYEKYIHEGIKIKITYVKNCRMEVVSTDYLYKNPLELPKEILKKVRQANLAQQQIYQNWQTYKTIDMVRKILDKKEKCDETPEN